MIRVKREILQRQNAPPYQCLQRLTHLKTGRIEYAVFSRGRTITSGTDLTTVQARYDEEVVMRRLAAK